MSAFRLALTHMSKQQLLDTNDGNLVKNITRPSGMNDMLDWVALGDHDLYQPFTSLQIGFNGTVKARGNGVFNWLMAMDHPMINQWRTDYHGRTENAEGNYSTLVTAQTKAESFGLDWVTVHATMQHPQQVNRMRGNVWQYLIPFVEVTVVPNGVDLTVGIDDGGATWSVAGAPIDVTYSVENEGDTANVSDIVLVCPIPTRAELDSLTEGDWTVEYSDNDESSYSGTPPSPLSNTTHVRFTLPVSTTPLAAGESNDVILSLQPISEGADTVSCTVATDYEVSDANNTDSLAITGVA